MMLLGGSADRGAAVNNLFATTSTRSGGNGSLLLPLGERTSSIFLDALSHLFKLLGCGLTCLWRVLALYVGKDKR
jgi:hypothetical protein